MSANKVSSYVALAFAGLISGFLTCASGRFLELFGSAGQNIYTFIGAIFGFVLVAYWWIFQGFRSIWRSVGFILSCTVAYACAVAAGMNAPQFLAFLSSVDRQVARNLEICFTGGAVGGGIVFLSAVFLLPNRTQWRYVPVYVVAFCFLSGVLGTIAWVFGPSLGTAIWHLLKATRLAERYEYSQSQPSGGANYYYSLFVLWQACIAPLLGLFLAHPGPFLFGTASAEHAPGHLPRSKSVRSPVLSVLFLFCVLLSLAYFVRSEMLAHRAQQDYSNRLREFQERALSEAPLAENLPVVQQKPPEQMLVLRAIADASPNQARITTTAAHIVPRHVGPSIPPSVFYSVNYYKPGNNMPTGALLMAAVQVTDYPNSDWARYELRNVPRPNAAFFDAASIAAETRQGNKIMKDSSVPSLGLDIYWCSGSKIVWIHFYAPEDGTFVKEYLALHPSSL